MLAILFTAIVFLIVVQTKHDDEENSKKRWILAFIAVFIGNLILLLLGLTVASEKGSIEKREYISFPISSINETETEYQLVFEVDSQSPDYLVVDKDNTIFTVSNNDQSEFRVVEEEIVLNTFWKYFCVPYLVFDTIKLDDFYEITLPIDTLEKVG